MKKINIAILLMFAAGVVQSQSRQTGPGVSQVQLIDSLRLATDNTWIKDNPNFIQTLPSYFYKGNEDKFKVAMLKINEQGIPYAYDPTIAMLDYLLRADSNATTRYGIDAGKAQQGVKINWKRSVNGLVWITGKGYKAAIDGWHLPAVHKCAGNTIVPLLWFRNIENISKASVHVTDAIAIIPYKEELEKIKRTNIELKTDKGKSIKGLGYDVNADGLPDLFSYDEEAGATTYTRMYMNVEGHWKCKWTCVAQPCATN